jgi:hypothetical protein
MSPQASRVPTKTPKLKQEEKEQKQEEKNQEEKTD